MTKFRIIYLIVLSGIAAVLFLVALPSDSAAQTPNQTVPTPLPACVPYHVTVLNANIRTCASTACQVVQNAARNTTLCIRGVADVTTWLQVDLAPQDSTSPMYFINTGVVAPGVAANADVSPATCQSYLVNTERTNVYACPGSDCSALGTLAFEEWLCAHDYGAAYPGWLYAADSDSGQVGWVQRMAVVPGRGTTGASPAVAAADGTFLQVIPASSDAVGSALRPGQITVDGPLPACLQYHVTTNLSNIHVCAGADCALGNVAIRNQVICVRGIADDPEWLVVDLDPDSVATTLYAIRADTVAPGGSPSEPEYSFECEPWEVTGRVNANYRQCPSLTCPVLGSLPPSTWVCARMYGGEYEEWIRADVPDGVSGVWIRSDVVSRMQITGTPTTTPMGPTASPTATATLVPTLPPQTPAVGLTPAGAQVEAATTEDASPAATVTCPNYTITVNGGIVRSCPSFDCTIVTRLVRDAQICVIGPAPFLESQWLVVDLDPASPDEALGFVSQTIAAPLAEVVSATVVPPAAQVLPTSTATPAPQICAPGTEDASCVTVTPTPVLLPVVEVEPIGPLLAQEITLTGLRVRNFELISPAGSSQFRFNIPDDWFPAGNNVLYLNMEYFENVYAFDGASSPANLISIMNVYLDNQLIASVSLNPSTVGQQTLAIPLPLSILSQTDRRNHTVRLALLAEDHCRANSESRVFVRSDQSYVHFEFYESSPVLDLAYYPRPLYNQRFANENEQVVMVLPPDSTDNDLEAAGRLAAGLGFLTYNGLQIRTVTADALSEQDRLNNNLLLVGQVGTHSLIDALYAANAFPTRLNPDGTLSVNGETIEPDEGVIQVAAHPDSTRYAVVAVTGQSPEALQKAAQALAGPSPIMGLRGPVALITEARPVQLPPAGYSLDTTVTFDELGYSEIVMNGIGVLTADVNFVLPAGQQLTEDAYLDLAFSYSDVLAQGRTTLALIMNEEYPLASAYLQVPGSTDDTGSVMRDAQGQYHVQARIPANSVRPGERNMLTIVVVTQSDWDCDPPDSQVVWFTVHGSSQFRLPQRPMDPALFRPMVGWFPVPLNTQPDLRDVWVSLPDNPTPLELEEAMRFVARLASSVPNGKGFAPRIHRGALPADVDLSAYNFLVFGRHTTNSFLAQINDILPQPFAPGTDEFQQILDDVSYRFPPGYEIGVLQTMASPWAADRLLYVVTGSGPSGQTDAANAVLDYRYGRTELMGDVVFITGYTATAVDTRLIEQNIDILTAIPDIATEAAIAALASPIAPLAYTVTPGPTLTLVPTRTPGPTLTPSPIFTLTPLPTVPTPLPTFTPLTPDEVAPKKVDLPEWFNILLAVTLIVVVFTLVYGLIRLLRRGQDRRG